MTVDDNPSTPNLNRTPNKATRTSFETLLARIDGGDLLRTINAAISDTAAGVVINHKKGSVTLKLAFKPIGNSNQVECAHTLSYDKPTMQGKVREDATGVTPLYVGERGKLLTSPENQEEMFNADGTRKARAE